MNALLFSLFIAALILGAIIWIMRVFERSNANDIVQRLQGIEDFNADILFNDGSCDNAIAIDKTSRKIAVVLNSVKSMSTSLDPIVYPFEDLIAVEVVQDDMSITKTNRGSQATGAAVGGVLLGPAGLLLGGLSGSKRHENKITKLSLRLYTSDLDQPLQEVFFWDSGSNGFDAQQLQSVITNMNQWYGRLRAIIESKNVTPRTTVALRQPPIKKKKAPNAPDELTEKNYEGRRRVSFPEAGSPATTFEQS